ncbi:MAG: hypothetical protein GY754_20830 [bacterium]|nr:hypothetical protein [bacterium]
MRIIVFITIFFGSFNEASANQIDALFTDFFNEERLVENNQKFLKIVKYFDSNQKLISSFFLSKGFVCAKNKNISAIRCTKLTCIKKGIFNTYWRGTTVTIIDKNARVPGKKIYSGAVNYSGWCPPRNELDKRERWVFENDESMQEIKNGE